MDNVDAHCNRAKEHGARITQDPVTHPYGERQYNADDLAGHSWTFSESVADMRPEDWGGMAEQLGSVKAMAPRVGFSSATAEATEELFRLGNDSYGCSVSVAFPAGTGINQLERMDVLGLASVFEVNQSCLGKGAISFR